MTTIVTGAASGIGRATTELLLSSGERVVAVDRDTSSFGGLRETERLYLVQGDVVNESTMQEACDVAGTIDGLVTCAGISRPGASDSYPMEQWSNLINVNLSAVFLSMRIAHRSANAGASFVAISSISGMQGFSGRAAYAASKAGVDGLVRTLAAEYAPKVRVNAIAPGYIMTDLVRSNLQAGFISEASILSRTPMQRWGSPLDVAHAIQFLLSGKSSWITGTTMVVDGGWMSYGLGLGDDE